MFKEIIIPDLTQKDELSVNLVRPGYKEKYANVKIGEDVYKELEDFEGRPNKSYALVVAVSPSEYWGDNKNNDAFEEKWLKKKHYTFTTNGTFFKNHVNKDPLKNYGDNEKSWYDDLMKRVLVLIGIDHDKAPDIVQDIENGKRLSVSMGCRVSHDTCSICGNEAPTVKDYCKCMKEMKGKILPDGRKVFVYNPDPTFFDLSKVVRPAGHIEYMIKKVVPKNVKEGSEKPHELWVPREYANEKVASETKLSAEIFQENQEFADKFANLKKVCDMAKVISGDIVPEEDMPKPLQDIVRASDKIINISNPEDIDDKTIDKLSEHPIKKVMATSNLMGIKFKLPEIIKMVLNRHKMPDIEELLFNLDKADFDPFEILDHAHPCEYLRKKPKVFKVIIKSKVVDSAPEDMDPKVASLLAPWFEKRSCYPGLVEKRAFLEIDYPEVDKTTLDQNESPYVTTEYNLNSTEHTKTIENALKALGLGTALAGTSVAALKMPKIGGKYLLPASIFGTLWGANSLNNYYNNKQASFDGDSIIPRETMYKVSELIDQDTMALTNGAPMADDQETVAGLYLHPNGTFSTTPYEEPSYIGSALSSVADWAGRNPEFATFGSLLAAGTALKGGIHNYDKILRGLGKIRGGFTSGVNTVSNAGKAVRQGAINTANSISNKAQAARQSVVRGYDASKQGLQSGITGIGTGIGTGIKNTYLNMTGKGPTRIEKLKKQYEDLSNLYK